MRGVDVNTTEWGRTSGYSFNMCFHPFCKSTNGRPPQSCVIASVKSVKIDAHSCQLVIHPSLPRGDGEEVEVPDSPCPNVVEPAGLIATTK